jgi:hypothetical protein
MADQLFRILAHLDAHFASDDQLPADADCWAPSSATSCA